MNKDDLHIPPQPWSIVAFGPFLPAETIESLRDIRPLPIQSADHGLGQLRPSLYIPLPAALSPEKGLQLEFASLADFTPHALVARIPWLKALRDASRAGSGPVQSTAAHTTLDSILDMVELPHNQAKPALPSDEGGAEAEALVAGVLSRIFADDDFRRMESAWQGVALLFEAAGDEGVHLALVPMVRENGPEVLAAIAPLLDEAPPDCLLLDVPFEATPVGMRLLEAAATLAERQLSPALCWFGPDFLHLEAWSDLEHLPYLPNHFAGFAYAQWTALRTRPAAFWTVAACNRFSLGPTSPGEPTSGWCRQRKPHYLAPVWGIAALLLQSKARTGSPLGFASQLLRIQDTTAEGCIPLETAISEDRVLQMVASGLLPLVCSSGKGLHLAEARTLNGESMLAPLILSTIIHTLISLRKGSGPCDDPELLADTLNQMFCQHPLFKGVLPAGAITVEAVGRNNTSRVMLEVRLQNRMFGAQHIECTFEW